MLTLGERLKSNCPAAVHGPEMCGSDIDLQAAPASSADHSENDDDLIVCLEEPLRLHAKGLEGVDVALQEVLHRSMTTEGPGVDSSLREPALHVGVADLEHGINIAPV